MCKKGLLDNKAGTKKEKGESCNKKGDYDDDASKYFQFEKLNHCFLIPQHSRTRSIYTTDNIVISFYRAEDKLVSKVSRPVITLLSLSTGLRTN